MIDDVLTIARLSPEVLMKERFVKYCLLTISSKMNYANRTIFFFQTVWKNKDFANDWNIYALQSFEFFDTDIYEVQLEPVNSHHSRGTYRVQACRESEYKQFMQGFVAWYEKQYSL